MKYGFDDKNCKILTLSNVFHIAKDLGPLLKFYNKRFPSGEYITIIYEQIQPEDQILILGNISGSNIMEFISIIDAAIRAGAKDITLIIPYFAYSRQDKMDEPYSSIGFELIAKMLNIFDIRRLVTIDFHSPQLLVLFNFEVSNIHPKDILPGFSEDYFLVTPDNGGSERLKPLQVLSLNKKRIGGNMSFNLYQNIEGKKCLILDDIYDSGQTLRGSIEYIYNKGASKVVAYCSHILSSNIPKELKYCSDSLGIRDGLSAIRLVDFILKQYHS